jgi:ribosomal protein L16
MKYMKRHKGTIPVPTGGSTKGTTLAFGEWGLRIKGNGVRLTAKQLQTVEEVIKRKIKPIKGARVWLRVFPDIPVCIKVRFCFLCLRLTAIKTGKTRILG